jgi:LytS/YehU family sensor histidine kinase
MKRQHAYWACQIGGWSLYVVARILLFAFVRDATWDHVLGFVMVGVFGLLYTHLYRLASKQRGWTRFSLKQLIPRIVLAALVLSLLTHFTCDLLGRHLLELSFYEEIESEMGMLLYSVLNGWILFMLWSVIYFGVHAVWNYRQAEVDKWKLEAQAETARLKALKLQLNPHFFFNSLNSVRALIAEDPDRAQRMVTRLARLLRNTLQVDDVKTVPLEEELSTVRTYLELESVRFEERLRYEIDADEAALNRPVPFLLVQTLAENGIKHGIARCQEGGVITINARVEDGDLCIRVTNPGTLETEEGGTGLANARERLQLLFGERASLTVRNADAATVEATVVLPARSEAGGTVMQDGSRAAVAAPG